MNNFVEFNGEKISIIDSVLDLSWKKINDFSKIEGLTHSLALRELILRENDLSSIPEIIVTLKTLQGLNIAGNQLTKIPDSIGNLNQLIILNSEYNQIKTLPETIGKLNLLQVLNLNKNQIS
ncbi:MAG: hypothetical protein HWN81_22545, partial [Candidatus Lokiarchaeota archaeon]|nr:hypothetical protein [Candidatus Lokiarchaeota archaeon]